jgi:hypothetical protein
MQEQWTGNIGDFGKLALLRQLMEGRRLAICWYLTGGQADHGYERRYFEYLNRPGEFRHLAPEIFDALKEIASDTRTEVNRIAALESSGLLNGTLFHGKKVPKRSSLREIWARDLIESIDDADLVFLDPDNGIQGKRITPKHVALAEIAALRRQDRTLVIVQRQSGRQAELKFLAEQLQSLGCSRIELIRFRLVSSRFFVVCDHDSAISERIALFARKWGNWIKTYWF